MHCAPFLLTMQIIFASVSYRRVVADLRYVTKFVSHIRYVLAIVHYSYSLRSNKRQE